MRSQHFTSLGLCMNLFPTINLETKLLTESFKPQIKIRTKLTNNLIFQMVKRTCQHLFHVKQILSLTTKYSFQNYDLYKREDLNRILFIEDECNNPSSTY